MSSESIEMTFFSPLSKHFYENSSHFPALTLIWSALAATRCSKCSPGPGTCWASPEWATVLPRGFLEKNGISGESQNGLGWQESEIIQFQPCRGCSIRIKLQGPRRGDFPGLGVIFGMIHGEIKDILAPNLLLWGSFLDKDTQCQNAGTLQRSQIKIPNKTHPKTGRSCSGGKAGLHPKRWDWV